MIEPREPTWDAATFDGARRDLLLNSLRLTPAQRLEWLEDAIDFAHHTGALARARAEDDRDLRAKFAA